MVDMQTELPKDSLHWMGSTTKCALTTARTVFTEERSAGDTYFFEDAVMKENVVI